jgi:8-oxo-dGTP pyrophosphatase MutT (NUDIX family)
VSETPEAEIIYRGRLITVRRQPVIHADGRVSAYELVDHPDAVGIVAVRMERTPGGDVTPLVALVRQARPAIGQETWEIPAGLVDPGEEANPQATAERELREETGYVAGRFVLLHRHYPSPGFMNEAISVYLATDLRHAPGAPAPDPHEIGALDWKPLDEAMAMCLRGEIVDGKTVIGLWLARDALAAKAPPERRRRPTPRAG